MFKIKDLIKFFMPTLSLDMGGGGGGGGAANQTVKQENAVSAFAAPYVENMLGKAQALTNQSYTPYSGQRTADFTGLQNQAFGQAGDLGVMGQTQQASDLASQAGIGALGMQYQGGQFGNQFQAPQDYQAGQFSNQFQAPQSYQSGQFSATPVNASGLQQYQMGPAQQVRTQSFTKPGTADAYMNPYMQSVVDTQQREARRASEIAGQGQQAEAVGRGAFGGSRDALMRAERERNLSTQLGDIQSAGSNAAYNQAMQQFNAEQNARLAAQQANQQAGLTTGTQNLNAALGVQQLGAGQNLQSQLANQQYGLQAQQLAEQSRQFGAGQDLQSANLGAQYGQSANQLAEQSRQFGAGQGLQSASLGAQYGQAANQLNAQENQFGANLGLQGLQAANQAASTLGQLGQNQYAQETGNINLQNQLGTQQQQQQQNILNQQYQDFLAQKQNPYNQLSFMQNMLSGLPIQSSTQSVYSNPSMLSQVAGLGLTGAAVANSGMLGKAKGGRITEQKRPAGLAELAISRMA